MNNILEIGKFAEGFTISQEDFDYIKNLYKFVYLRDEKSFYDTKYHKTVAYYDKNLFTNEKEIRFNLNWLAYECIITKSKKLFEILRKYIENNNKYLQVKEILDRINAEDKKYIDDRYANIIHYKKDLQNLEVEKEYEKLIVIIRSLL